MTQQEAAHTLGLITTSILISSPGTPLLPLGQPMGFLAPCPRGGLEQRNWKTANCPAYLPAAVGAHCSSMVPTRSGCASRSHPCPQHSPPTPPPQSAQPHTCSPRRALSPFPAKTPCCWGDVQTTVRRLELGSKSQHLLRLYNPPGGGAFGAGLGRGVVWAGLAARPGSPALWWPGRVRPVPLTLAS